MCVQAEEDDYKLKIDFGISHKALICLSLLLSLCFIAGIEDRFIQKRTQDLQQIKRKLL